MPEAADLHRLRREYSDREKRLTGKDPYSPFNSPGLFAVQQRSRAILRLLRFHGFQNLHDRSILEIGCGSGGVLAEFLVYGANPALLHGIDLLYPRLIEAHQKLSSSKITNADGQFLPFPTASFDLVLQFTAFSSVLDDHIRHIMAAEMLRVLKPNGAVLWYDFWLNPTNHQTRGIRPDEIRGYFPSCSFTFRKITLAPPIARRIVPVSWGLALFLEALKVFNSHFLVVIRKQFPSFQRP